MGRIIRRSGAGAAAAGLVLALLMTPAAALARPPLLLGLNLLPPIGNADSYTTPFETELVVDAPGVLANDTDLDSPTLQAHLVSGPSNGALVLETSGHFHYLPDPGFHGVDTFKYRPFDGDFEALLPATVKITVAKPVPTPTPRPTPTPMPTPTPTPTPTPMPTPAPTPTPTPRPTPTPTPRPTLPLPTLPLPTLPLPGLPTPTPTPSSSATPTPSPSPAAGATAAPTPPPDIPSGPPPAPSGSAGPGVIAIGSTNGSGTPPAGGLSLPPAELAGGSSSAGPVTLGSFGPIGLGIEWVVPTVLLTVPGFLLLLIGLAQLFGGLIWLPLARRSLRGDGRPTGSRPARLPN